MAALQAGHSGTGMRTQALRDLDYVNPRQPLRKTALPPELRRKMGLSSRDGGKAGKKFAPPLAGEDWETNDKLAHPDATKPSRGFVSRATRVRMDPNDKDNLPAIGMSNVLKKADSYDDNSAARDRRRKNPDCFGEPKKRAVSNRKPRRGSKQTDQKTASTTRERGSRNSQHRSEKATLAAGEGYSKVARMGQQRSGQRGVQPVVSRDEVKSHKPNRRPSPVCSDASPESEAMRDEHQPMSPAQLIKADMRRQQDYDDDDDDLL